MGRKRRPGKVREYARGRIKQLLDLAEKTPAKAKRYVGMALALVKKYKVRLPGKYKRRVCKKCNAFLVPGKSLRVRTTPSRKTVVFTCLECGTVSRYPYKPKPLKREE